jgi:hypothetical protein
VPSALLLKPRTGVDGLALLPQQLGLECADLDLACSILSLEVGVGRSFGDVELGLCYVLAGNADGMAGQYGYTARDDDLEWPGNRWLADG